MNESELAQIVAQVSAESVIEEEAKNGWVKREKPRLGKRFNLIHEDDEVVSTTRLQTRSAILCHHTRPDRPVTVALETEKLKSGQDRLYWIIISGGFEGGRFNAQDYHNDNRTYWLRFTES